MFDWLNDLTTWLKEQFMALWNAFTELLQDMLLNALEMVLDVFAKAVEAISVPDFMTTYNLGTLLGEAGPTVVWIANTFRLGEGLALIAAGYAFRLLRKLLTLGQW